MSKGQMYPAKVTRPSVTGVLERKRLFRLLDKGRKRPAVWVSGPAGSGKIYGIRQMQATRT
jgi:ATP/maltotriose-dependent transcriptional regulator MalT